MKKIMSIFILVIMTLSFTACQKETTSKFVRDKNGMKIEAVFTSKGDELTSKKSISTVNYQEAGLTTQDQIESFTKQMKALSSEMNKMKGVKESLVMDKEKLTETLEIDYTKADISELIEKKIIQTPAGSAKKLSMKKTREALLSDGFTEVK